MAKTRDGGTRSDGGSGGRRLQRWFTGKLPLFWSNWISAVGSMVMITIVMLMAAMFVLFVFNVLLGRESNPYVDLVAFMLLPALLLAGLGLVLLGNFLRRRRIARGDKHVHAVEIGGATLARRAVVVGIVSIAVMFGLGLFSYEAYNFTDSNQFCSVVCHKVMAPEASAHARSPHSNVHCVSCHIGPGASWFVRSKLSGLRQVYAVLTHTYDTPIPTPVENLRPARETCEVCHAPQQFHGSQLVTRKHYESDENNTETVTALVVHIGGPEAPGKLNTARGIHWHVAPQNQVRYRYTDNERHDIAEVVQTTPEGEIRYLKEGADPDSTQGTWRVMDCLDCHNRPTHIYDLPARALDIAFATGRLDTTLRWLRKEGEVVLREVEPVEGQTAQLVSDKLRSIYQTDHPEDVAALEKELPATARELAALIDENVWPNMKITWGTYRSNLSHFTDDGELGTGGCFRCHDEEHTSSDGQTIGQDCDKCHDVLAWREPSWSGVGGIPIAQFLRR